MGSARAWGILRAFGKNYVYMLYCGLYYRHIAGYHVTDPEPADEAEFGTAAKQSPLLV